MSPAAAPVPERPTYVGLLGSESVIVSVALLVPTAVGVKVMDSTHMPEGLRDTPQVELGSCINCVSEKIRLFRMTELELVLVRFKGRRGLVLPTLTFPKPMLRGDTCK